MRPSKKFIKESKIYLHFAREFNIENKPLDLEKQYVFESMGRKKYQEIFGDAYNPNNIYAVGKAWKEWHVTNWLEDINSTPPLLFIEELYEEYKDNPEIIEMLNNAILPQVIK